MARVAESKNTAKKQTNVMALQKKLKAIEEKLKRSDKAWQQKFQAQQASWQKKQAVAYQRGYAEGLAESGRKETARKKALQIAERAFEKAYGTKAQPLNNVKKVPATQKVSQASKGLTVKQRATPSVKKDRGKASKKPPRSAPHQPAGKASQDDSSDSP